MANTYTYTGPGTRWAVGNPTAEDLLNISRINADHLHEALNTIMSTSTANGALSLPADVTIANGFGLTIGGTSQLNIGSVTPELQVLGTGSPDSTAMLAMFNSTAGGPLLSFLKSRSATIGGSGIVGSGDAVVQLAGYADDGTDYASAVGMIAISIDGTPGANDTPGKFQVSLTPDGTQATTEVLRINNAGNAMLGAGAPTSPVGLSRFLEIEGADAGLVLHDSGGNAWEMYNSSNVLYWAYNGGTKMQMSAAGCLGLNEALPEGSLSININQAAYDDIIFALKSSDISHGMTDHAEADTYFSIKKDNVATGGVALQAFSEGNAGLVLHARPGAIPTTATGSSLGACPIKAQQWDGGTDVIAAPATSNALAVTDGTTTRFIVKGNGAIHATNVTSGSGDLDGTALDGEDDIGLIRAFERTVHSDLGIIMSKWDGQVEAHADDLRRVGVVQGDFYCLQRMDSLLGGGVWQNHCRIQDLREVLDSTRKELTETQAQLQRLMA